jgi:hypothetical protein
VQPPHKASLLITPDSVFIFLGHGIFGSWVLK